MGEEKVIGRDYSCIRRIFTCITNPTVVQSKKSLIVRSRCGKRFVRKSECDVHINRNHRTERPFPCTFEGCGRSFATKSELKRHAKTHDLVI